MKIPYSHFLLSCLLVCSPTHAMESKQAKDNESKISQFVYSKLPEEKKKNSCVRWLCDSATCAKAGGFFTVAFLCALVFVIPKFLPKDPPLCSRQPIDGKWCFTLGIQNGNCTNYEDNQIQTTCATNTTNTLSGMFPTALEYERQSCANSTDCFLYLLQQVDCTQSTPTVACENMIHNEPSQYNKKTNRIQKFKTRINKKDRWAKFRY